MTEGRHFQIQIQKTKAPEVHFQTVEKRKKKDSLTSFPKKKKRKVGIGMGMRDWKRGVVTVNPILSFSLDFSAGVERHRQ